VEQPELSEDPRFNCNNQRVLNHADLKPIVEEWSSKLTIDEIVGTLLKAGIPAAPINTIDRVVKDPHIAGAREMFVDCEHPKAGKLKITGSQLKFEKHKIEKFFPAPTLGQHNIDVFCEKLGMTEEEVIKLADDKII